MNTGTIKFKVLFVIPLHEYNILGHQLLPVFLRLRTRHRPIGLLRNHREDLKRELRERRIGIRTTHDLAHPLPLLKYSRRDLRVDQEDQGFSTTGFGGILQVERLNLMLVQVWECSAPMRLRDSVTDIIEPRSDPYRTSGHWTTFASVDTNVPTHIVKYPHTFSVILLVGMGLRSHPPERQPTLADVLRVIVLRYR